MSQETARKPKLADLQKLLRSLPKVTLDPNHHEVSPIPDAVKVWFIDSKFMALFEPFAELNARTLKLVNYEKAAINLTFFEKHKYKVNKEPEPEEIAMQLEKKLEELKGDYGQTELFADAYTQKHKDEQRRQIVEIQEILNSFHEYQFAVSNYFRNYTYWYVTWRWENPDGTLGHGNDHLLKDETDYDNNATILKQNVVFVDMQRISEHTPYQSKKVEKFLNGFEKRIEVGTVDVFVKTAPNMGGF
jgi:hypothetical protein